MSSMQKRIAFVTVLVIIAVGTFIFLQPDPGPCRELRAICEAQGFKRGRTNTERRAFQENCFRPLFEGQTIGNAKIDPDIITACKERQNKRRSSNRGGNQGSRRSGEPQETQDGEDEE
jgi:hypothetical protein